jgi:hypothetical protein
MKTQIHKFVLLVLLACIAGAAFGQTFGAGTITGAVTDPPGSPVPGVAVVVRNSDTGIERPLRTNESGIYVVPFVQPGHYEITASKAGFTKTVRRELTLQVGQALTADFALTLQTTTETMTVTGQPGVVDPEKTELSQVVSIAAV